MQHFIDLKFFYTVFFFYFLMLSGTSLQAAGLFANATLSLYFKWEKNLFVVGFYLS